MPRWPPFPQSHRLETIRPLRPLPVFHRPRLHRPSHPLPSQPHMFPMRSPLVLVLHLTDVKGLMSIVRRLSLPQVVQPQFLQRKCQLHPPLPPQLELLPPPVPRVPFHHPLPLSLFVLVPAVGAPLSCPLCTTGYCDIHCHSHRCHFHHPSSPAPHPPTTPSARSGNPPRHPLQVCRAVGCPSPTQPLHSRFLFSPLYKSKVPPSHPSTPVAASMPAFRLHRACSTRLSSSFLQSPLHQPSLCGPRPSFPVGKRSGGGLPTDDGTVNPSSVVHSFGLGQFNCRRLWGRDGAVHDGFMGLVSCLNQLDLQVLCVQETVSFDGNSSRRPAFPLRRPCWKLWPRGGFSVPFLNPFVSCSRDCGSPVSPLASGLRCHLRLLILRATCWHLCRCPCGVLAHIGRFCTSCLTHPSRVADVACWGLQCVASPFPAWSVTTN